MTRILFVCTGNTCRSPMAEALIKSKKVEGIDVKSAGIFAMNGSDASQGAERALLDKGIEISHSSSQLSKEHVDWATYILTMTVGHKTAIAERFPGAIEKTFTLKEFVENRNEDIIDPYGGSMTVYKKTLEELEELIGKLVIKIGK